MSVSMVTLTNGYPINRPLNYLMFEFLHPRKWRTRAPVLTGGPGAAPGGVASKNGWVHMRVQGGFISYGYFVCLSICLSVSPEWRLVL